MSFMVTVSVSWAMTESGFARFAMESANASGSSKGVLKAKTTEWLLRRLTFSLMEDSLEHPKKSRVQTIKARNSLKRIVVFLFWQTFVPMYVNIIYLFYGKWYEELFIRMTFV